MLTVRDAVIAKPVFEKVAATTLSEDSTKWHEDILQQFFEEVDYLPQNVGADVALSAVDTNKGYAKGSVVIWFKDKKINFPVIIKDYKLSPFDVFVIQDGDESIYIPANFDNVKTLISSGSLGTLENIWDKGGGQLTELKTPGGVYPKQLMDVSENPQLAEMVYPPFSKMSGWRDHARKEDLEKFAATLKKYPEIKANYVDNTGDLITNVIDLAHSKKEVIPDTNKRGDIDLKGLVDAKQAVTVIDSELFDVNDLEPVTPPSVCEIRLYEFPSMEDFIESGDSIGERFLATRNGRPVVGVVLDVKEEGDFSNMVTETSNAPIPLNASDIEKSKAVRQKRDQIFISMDGGSFCIFKDWDKTGIGFYGSKVIPIGKNGVQKVMNIISNNTSDEFITLNRCSRYDGSDKAFEPVKEMNQGRDRYPEVCCDSSYDSSLAIIYGAGDAFECVRFRGIYRKISVNGSPVYTSGDVALIPANIATIQRVRKVEDEVYRMATLGSKKIYLIPESSVIFNTEYMKEYNKEDFMRPSLPMQKVYEDANISKVAVEVNPEGGYTITGKPYENLSKIAGTNGFLTTKNAVTALRIMGMEKSAAETALKHAINRYLSKEASDRCVTIYGLRNDYINPDFNPHAEHEKVAKHQEILKKMAAILKRDLTKEASAINDPEAVDVVLSLNFINKDNLKGFIANIGEMKRILSELAKMTIASRLGLSDLDESALTKSMSGLDEVVRGLENIKLAIK